MSNNRIKVPALAPPATREEMERLAGEIADTVILRRDYAAQMDAGIKTVRQRYEAIFTDLDVKLDVMMDQARAWAEANPGEFSRSRSVDMVHAIVGFRQGMPQLKTLRGWTWDRVLEKLKLIGGYAAFIRVKSEVDKQAILAASVKFLPVPLREIGCQVIQEETFFVEPKLTEVEKRQAIPR